MSSFDDDERSVSGNRPIDLYTIATPTALYLVTSHVLDVSYLGNTYAATPMSRGNQQLAMDQTGRELIVYLPISHPLIQRFAATGIPEHSVVVTLQRLQVTSGIAVQAWTGFAGGISIDGHTALVRVPALTDDAMKIRLPVIAAQRVCNHVLYDAQCTVVRATFTDNETITALSGNTVTTPSTATGSYFVFGDIKHVATGQLRMVLAQAGPVLTLNAPFVGAQLGDSVQIAAGCAHDVTTCRDKFNNVVNFGGHPDMNAAINFWTPSGLGVTQQV